MNKTTIEILNDMTGEPMMGLHVETPDPGVTKSLNKKLALLADPELCPFGRIVFNSIDLDSTSGACFSYNAFMGSGSGTVRVDLRDGYEWNEETKCIKIDNIVNALILQHELNHFMHMHIDDGKYNHPNHTKYKFNTTAYMRDSLDQRCNDPQCYNMSDVRKLNEMEVCWRCLWDDMVFGASEETTDLDRRVQMFNLSNYDKWNWRDLYDMDELRAIELMNRKNSLSINNFEPAGWYPPAWEFQCAWYDQMSIRNMKPWENTKYSKIPVPQEALDLLAEWKTTRVKSKSNDVFTGNSGNGLNNEILGLFQEIAENMKKIAENA